MSILFVIIPVLVIVILNLVYAYALRQRLVNAIDRIETGVSQDSTSSGEGNPTDRLDQ